MKVQYVNSVLSAVKEVFTSMLDMAVIFENPIRKNTDRPAYEIISIINIRGVLCGCIVLSYPEEMAKIVASELLGEKLTEINDETIDALCEVANMVTGVADTELEIENISYSLPEFYMGRNKMFYPENSFIFSMPCLLDAGAFEVDIALSDDTDTVIE